MSIPSELNAGNEEEQTDSQNQLLAHHPFAPSDELFDISTTVDPSYVISLIRKLLPPSSSSSTAAHVNEDYACEPKVEFVEEGALSKPENELCNSREKNEYVAMDTVNESGEVDGEDVRDDRSGDRDKHKAELAGEEAWEEYGCVLWDLAASKTHAELMVQNLVLDVLLANLIVSQSARITEISLGILGNIACHETLRSYIASTNGLIEAIVDQLFLDDIPCLSEACRLLTLCFQGSEGLAWAEAIRSEHVLSRILWITENTLNVQLIEKSVGLLLVLLEGKMEVRSLLLPGLMNLGLPKILINLFAFEMNKLMGERVPERYSVTDLLLRTTEALSIVDDYSQEICSSKELFRLLIDLIKLPDKIEVASCCVTAAILMANMLTDAAELVSEISQDMFFLQGLFDIFPFASDDADARSALWSIISRLLLQLQKFQVNPSVLHQYVSVLVNKSDLIEDQLFDNELDDNTNHQSSTARAAPSPRTTALSRIYILLSQWKTLKDHDKRNDKTEEKFDYRDVDRLLKCCCEYAQ